MNKQVVIAGLLGAIAGQIDVADPTPCEDISTRAAFVAHGLAAEAKAAWEGKIEALESAATDDGAALDTAQAALELVTGIVLPYFNALNTATQNEADAGNVKSNAQNLLDSITTGTSNEITGDSMLLGVAAPDVGTADQAVTDAKTAYDTKFAQINDATFVDTEGDYGTANATVTGFRAVLTANMQTQSLMLDAQELATTAEATAITAYTDQEAVVNALGLINGCKTAVEADLTSDDQATYNLGATTADEKTALLVAKFAECCDTRMTTFIATLASGDPNYGDTNTATVAIDCASNSGFNMLEQEYLRLTLQTDKEALYVGSCTQTTTASTTVPVNCDTTTVYTNYRTAFALAKRNERMRDAVDHACTDFYKQVASYTATYDCSNGILSNSGGSYAEYTWADMTADSGNSYVLPYHYMNALTGIAGTELTASLDPIWVYRETLNTAAAASTYEGPTADTDDYLTQWVALIGTVSTAQVAWTLAEAKYWAYKQTTAINTALLTTADTSEAALLVTKEQKVDLLDAADADVEACALLVAMATSDLADEVAALDALQATLVAAEEAHAVQVYLATQAAAAALVQSDIVADWEEQCGDAADSASCTNALTQLGELVSLAQSNFDEIQVALDCVGFNGTTCTGFYATAVSEAQAMKNLSDEALLMAQGKVSEFTGSLEMLESQYAAGVNACKGLGYDRAQAAKKQLMDLETANTAAAATVLTDYTAKSAFATTEETNTLCAYPAKVGDAAQEPRPECKDGYCCGAAQKFLKDGTKLAIETCQKAEGVHTYEYFPPLPEGSPVEPTPEIWRFQCISGAQKLAATAAAALAASYMMA